MRAKAFVSRFSCFLAGYAVAHSAFTKDEDMVVVAVVLIAISAFLDVPGDAA